MSDTATPADIAAQAAAAAQGTEPAQTAPPVQEPQANEPAPATQGDGPWANDLASTFEDEAERQRVDTFLREKVQPYVTKLEQSRGEFPEEYVPAKELWDDLRANPVETYLAITEELLGPEVAQVVEQQIQRGQQPDPDAAAQQVAQGQPPQGAQPPAGLDLEPDPQGDPELEAMKAEWRQSRAREAYEQELTALKGRNADVKIVDDWFHPFVVAAEGDLDDAVGRYKAWAQTAGIDITPENATPPPEPAPGVIGSDTAAGAVPPVEKKYTSIDEALEDTLVEMRAQKAAPPVVGTV